MLSYPTSTLSQLGQPVWYGNNSQSGQSVPHGYNNISAGLGWPVWIGFLSTWVVRMVRVNSTERCVKSASHDDNYVKLLLTHPGQPVPYRIHYLCYPIQPLHYLNWANLCGTGTIVSPAGPFHTSTIISRPGLGGPCG